MGQGAQAPSQGVQRRCSVSLRHLCSQLQHLEELAHRRDSTRKKPWDRTYGSNSTFHRFIAAEGTSVIKRCTRARPKRGLFEKPDRASSRRLAGNMTWSTSCIPQKNICTIAMPFPSRATMHSPVGLMHLPPVWSSPSGWPA